MYEELAGINLVRPPDGNYMLQKATRQDVEVLLKLRPQHPLSLQCASLLAQHLQKPEPSLRMLDAYRAALQTYSDPALAMQHLLHCMYYELMVWCCALTMISQLRSAKVSLCLHGTELWPVVLAASLLFCAPVITKLYKHVSSR